MTHQAMAPSLLFLFHFHDSKGIIKSRGLGGAGSGGVGGHWSAPLLSASQAGIHSLKRQCSVTSLCTVFARLIGKCGHVIKMLSTYCILPDTVCNTVSWTVIQGHVLEGRSSTLLADCHTIHTRLSSWPLSYYSPGMWIFKLKAIFH